MRRSTVLLAMAGTIFLSACGQKIEPDEPVALDKIPPNVMKAAEKQLPGYQFSQAWIKKEDGKPIYEIRGKNRQGQTREVELTPDGVTVEVE